MKKLRNADFGLRIVVNTPGAVLDGRFRASKMPYNDLRRVSSAEVDLRRCNELQLAAPGKFSDQLDSANAEVGA